MKYFYIIFCFAIGLTSLSFGFTEFNNKEKNNLNFYRQVFPNVTNIVVEKIKDTISVNPVNNTLLKAYSSEGPLGFIRNIHTTTGCSSACLPVSYTSFYTINGSFLKILSKSGLTKINHAPFSAEDYSQLELIISLAPVEFTSIGHPKELTDAISGATLKKYQHLVVKGAAYSSLRIHLYNLDTQNIIKMLK